MDGCIAGLPRERIQDLLRIVEAVERLEVIARGTRTPAIAHLTMPQLLALPGEPVELRYVTVLAFGREYSRLQVFLLGCKRPIKWDEDESTWVDA